ncbi:DUF4149 domain-containing protein [Nitrosophilus kaiyonis]|uniref:DUF4149 domain-containing protein n=1 Tax=Nitrosophilus kaiyonis TaxID=2930200 RepID=UPI00249123FD|nr:DUF4149 domain-containing protein [Nitrosophilus kaiyonis]
MKILKWVDIIYIILIGIGLGDVLVLGSIVAPTIFHSEIYLQKEILSHYQEGLLMTAIFLKSNYLLNFIALFIIIREAYSFKLFQRDKITIAAAMTAVFAIFMFSFYYTPDILAYQAAGEEMTKSEIFDKIHKGSEIDFGLLAFSLFALLFRKVQLLMK